MGEGKPSRSNGTWKGGLGVLESKVTPMMKVLEHWAKEFDLQGTQSLQKGVKSSYLSFEKISLLPVWSGLEEARWEKGEASLNLFCPLSTSLCSSPKGPLVLCIT